MSTRKKLLIAGVLMLSLLSVAGLALASSLASMTFLPAVYKQPTPTASPTPTLTPTPQSGVYITGIESDPPGPDIESEYVSIKNQTANSIRMTGWKLKDKTSTSFTFPSYTLPAGKTVRVWSRDQNDEDPDSSYDLYWGLNSAIWHNISDCGYLYDSDGDLVDEYCYGQQP